ncbi:TlpA family protein disulfide reductase [Sinomicrobium oceani]|uniref:TlpA family protein disulfide reductase n=1 Tax=Sinomicrobium oceani TaxID=1150368 RepID=UPI00227B2ACB|nr:TlpA disulfide reductase family protein [Sinomicrobium oceani]
MKLTKSRIYNLLLLIFVVLMLFTPVGTTVKIWVNRIIAFSPSPVPDQDRERLEGYHWNLKTMEGGLYDFNEARGRVVLVNFWATWCPPCIAEMPALHRLYDSYGDRMLFLFVTGEDPETVEKFMKAKGWEELPVYFPVSKVPEKMYSSSIPATWVLDKSGNIVISKKGTAAWDSEKVRQMLDQWIAE